MKFHVLIQGGVGDDVWDRDVEVDAVDFADALGQANRAKEHYRGTVMEISRYPVVAQSAHPPVGPAPVDPIDLCTRLSRDSVALRALLKRHHDELENMIAKVRAKEDEGWEGTRRRHVLQSETKEALK